MAAHTSLQSAQSLLSRAVELDTAQRYSEALICYEEAIQMLIKCIPGNVHEYLSNIGSHTTQWIANTVSIVHILIM